ncbi:DnaJ homolog subfamily C member 17 [Marchantia polymorpha subsp. ruderalis]|uniref:J domain-containing protein n=2 Tax=Marchantia polymorpha TaxID=3197 RepID=A0A176WHN9_MARPO|nr:hypothetical protein AXG93_3384s1400 [Marchantia polymorpha subsp. ruderalis]PTQ45302.1 hypothetical protein MARPO_0015s0100 [Marchantia polymorpha]BBN01533.1 hypothetical protein Mp_2g08150 [Marchantia polymorpha subsp. ruderalis]|eukprot:PTQ45302.1 hypothetical protein MARPO_0015s0100 [Marchantia polymorpha]
MEEEDLYLVLGIESGGPEVSQLEVRKSYRSRALLCHPDKRRKDAPAAALEFDKLQKAYEVLGDEKARKAYDELWKLRKSRVEKERQLSHKRQKMMQDLRDRERAFEMQRNEKREEEEASKRLKAEIARIRAMRSKKPTPGGFDFTFGAQSNGTYQKEESARPQAAASTPAQTLEMEKTLKASWSCEAGGGGGYTASRLIEIFKEFGDVEDVVIRQSKSKKKGSALVVMGSKAAAIAATCMQCGDLSNPLLVVPAVPIRGPFTEPVLAQPAPTQAKGSSTVGSGYHSFENEILTKMRQAAERARIIKEMKEADAKET